MLAGAKPQKSEDGITTNADYFGGFYPEGSLFLQSLWN